MTGEQALQLAGEASDLAREAFATGDNEIGIAAIVLAAQLVQLARIDCGLERLQQEAERV
jgi:hypothetical protein